jgi:uncharacterized protein
MERRAYSVLDIKSTDGDKYVIEGLASTPTPDRYGDIVEPLGAVFKTPMSLLWQHDADKPVGQMTFARPTKTGIPFEAKITKASEFESTVLRERALEAWESVKHGLVRGVSIGFRALEYAFMDNGGIRFSEWEWLELSLVTIPANAEATITTFKHYDRAAIRGARPLVIPVKHCEHLPPGARALISPGASGIRLTSQPIPEEG